MTLEILLDNDVLIKCCCYSIIQHLGYPGGMGILGAARFVVRSHLRRGRRVRDPAGALARFNQYLEAVEELEPTTDELRLASAMEELALRLGVDLDGGESQLCAMAVLRGWPLILTGDKRAIVALEAVQRSFEEISGLRGRVVSLEQAVAGVSGRMGPSATRSAICAEPDVDKAISICFECTRSRQRQDFEPEGLRSYIEDLRVTAPSMLYPSNALPLLRSE